MAGKFGSREGGVLRVTHDLTQEELAQLVGASRETVNKALADFASRGWLRLDGKSVIILDPERLARPGRERRRNRGRRGAGPAPGVAPRAGGPGVKGLGNAAEAPAARGNTGAAGCLLSLMWAVPRVV